MNMKKLLPLLLCLAMALSFGACGGESEEAGSESELKTLGDVFALEADEFQSAFGEDYYACVFTIDGVTTRVDADMPEGLYAETQAISYDDSQHDEKVEELLAPVEIKNIDDVSSLIPDEESVQALKGKTARELMEDGYTLEYYTVDGDNIYVSAIKDYAAFDLEFHGKLREDDPDWLETIADLPVEEAGSQSFPYTLFEADFRMPE